MPIYMFLKKNIRYFILLIVVIVLLYLSFYPLYMLLIKSFKTISDDQTNPFGFPTKFTLENYQYAWIIVKPYMINSLFITITQTLGVVIIASFAAFAFVKFNFPYKNILFYLVIALLMVPGIVTLTSQYELVNNLNLVNSYWGVILPGISGTLPFAIFLLRTSFVGVSKELFDAGAMDGASSFQLYRHIMLPLSKPIIWTLVITTFIGAWNDYLWSSLILLDEELQTLPIGLVSFTQAYYTMTGGYGVPFAAYVLSSLPLIVIFLVASKQFIAGLTSGSIKM